MNVARFIAPTLRALGALALAVTLCAAAAQGARAQGLTASEALSRSSCETLGVACRSAAISCGGAAGGQPGACAPSSGGGLALGAHLQCFERLVQRCGPGFDIAAGTRLRNIANTEWVGEVIESDDPDGVGRKYVFRFRANGILNYDNYTGTWDTGRWIRAGDHIVISMNSGFAVHLGKISGRTMNGSALNVRDSAWGWRLTREK